MTTRFCSMEQVRQALGVEDNFTGDDYRIAIYIEQATTMIRQYTRREWSSAVYTDYLDTHDIDVAISRGKGVYITTLREKPISVAPGFYPVLHYSASGDWDDTSAIDPSLYSIDVRKNQLIMYPGAMTYRPRSLRCVYTAGYLTQAELEPANANADPLLVMVSNNLRQACLAQAMYMLRRELNTTAGTSRESGGNRLKGYTVTQTGFIAEALALIRTETRLFIGGS